MTTIDCFKRGEQGYPLFFDGMPDPPQEVFVRGILPAHNDLTVAIVGTRKPTAYGKRLAHDIATLLAERGAVVVSGLAYGIDGIAHHATLDAGGRTIAVLAGSPAHDEIYPALHRTLGERIITTGGALVSERAPGSEVRGYSFHLRNRIIAGLSRATIVIEGTLESGSLITARAALEYGREVFACPHPLYSPGGLGPNMLIKNGAHLLSDPAEVLEMFGYEYKENISTTVINATELEKKILNLCTTEPHSADMLSYACTTAITTIIQTLSVLELRGALENYQGMFYAKKSKPKTTRL